MSALAGAVDEYLRAMAQAQTVDEIAATTPPLMPHIQAADSDELTKQLKRLYVELRQASLPMIATTALTCGVMVESGGDPDVCGPFFLEKLEKLLGELRVFWARVREIAGEEPTHDNAMALGEQCFAAIQATHPNPAWAFYFHMMLAMGTVAHLSKSPTLRAAMRARPELLTEAHNFDILSRDDPTYLTCMFRLLDDEPLLVLHPGERKGFEVRMSAIADVLQLDTLCAATLIGDPADGWLTGQKPPPDIIAAVTNGPVRFDLTVDGVFNLWTWHALRPNGTLPASVRDGAFVFSSLFVGPGMSEPLPLGLTQNELLLPWDAFPDQIPKFDGIRVLLLNKRSPAQDWWGTRRYRDMPGSLVVERVLGAPEVTDWLARISSTAGHSP